MNFTLIAGILELFELERMEISVFIAIARTTLDDGSVRFNPFCKLHFRRSSYKDL